MERANGPFADKTELSQESSEGGWQRSCTLTEGADPDNLGRLGV